MIALQGTNLSHAYIVEPTFEHLSFAIQAGEKIGLIGPNGAGKTTLFKCLTGELALESGQISLARDYSMGYLEQRIDFKSNTSLLDSMMEVFEDVLAMRQRMSALEQDMSAASEDKLEAIYEAYAELTHEYERLGGYSVESRVKGVVQGLGFSEADYDRPLDTFSGGERTRLELAALLVREPDILLLDEPTNHLDLNALEWLETYLKNYRGSLLLISHDRYFLDQVVTRILELDHGVLTSYTGNYSRYLLLKAEAEAAQEKAFASQQKMLAKEQAYIEKNRAGRMAKQARGREKKLARIELINNVQSQKKAHLRQFDVDTSAKIVLDIQDLSKSFGAETVFHDLNLTVFRQDRIGIIGPNGCGKSTLLKTIIGQLPADGGDVAFGSRVQWAYYDQEQSRLNFDSTVLDQVLYNSYLDLPESRAELAKMLFTENDWEKRVGSLSGGEKARLSLLMLLLEQPNFIIMDEPTNHLDIASKRIMEDYLQTYKGTLLIVSHDRYFLDQVTEKTWAFEEQGIQIYYGNYSYYREKKAEQREMEASLTASLTAPDAPHQQSSPTAKTTKRNISKSKLRKTIADCELAITEKEAALAGAEEAILTAAKDYTEDALATYEAHVQQKERLEAELEELYQTWSHSSDLLEELTHE